MANFKDYCTSLLMLPGHQATSSSPNSDGVVCVDRGALARYMVHFAREQYGDNITFHFNTKFLVWPPSACFCLHPFSLPLPR